MNQPYMKGYYPKKPTFIQGWCPNEGQHCATFNPCLDLAFREATYYGAATCQYVVTTPGEVDPRWIRYSSIPQDRFRNGIFWPTAYKADDTWQTLQGCNWTGTGIGSTSQITLTWGTEIDPDTQELYNLADDGVTRVDPVTLVDVTLTQTADGVTMDAKFPPSDQSPFISGTDEIQVKPPLKDITPTYPADSGGMVYFYSGYSYFLYATPATFRLDLLDDGSPDPASPWYMKGWSWFANGNGELSHYLDLRSTNDWNHSGDDPFVPDSVILLTSYYLPPPPPPSP